MKLNRPAKKLLKLISSLFIKLNKLGYSELNSKLNVISICSPEQLDLINHFLFLGPQHLLKEELEF